MKELPARVFSDFPDDSGNFPEVSGLSLEIARLILRKSRVVISPPARKGQGNKAMVKIRLRREGAKDRPFYRIVVADSRARKEGRFIEIVGTYDPAKEDDNYTIDLEKVDSWIGKGAQPSDTVRSLIKKARSAASA